MKNIIFAAAIFAAGSAPGAFADTWQEREALARLSDEVVAMERLALDAQEMADADARIVFDYDAFVSDLRTIRAAIQQHLNAPIDPVRKTRSSELSSDYTNAVEN